LADQTYVFQENGQGGGPMRRTDETFIGAALSFAGICLFFALVFVAMAVIL
jgi:hypothetical protein